MGTGFIFVFTVIHRIWNGTYPQNVATITLQFILLNNLGNFLLFIYLYNRYLLNTWFGLDTMTGAGNTTKTNRKNIPKLLFLPEVTEINNTYTKLVIIMVCSSLVSPVGKLEKVTRVRNVKRVCSIYNDHVTSLRR